MGKCGFFPLTTRFPKFGETASQESDGDEMDGLGSARSQVHVPDGVPGIPEEQDFWHTVAQVVAVVSTVNGLLAIGHVAAWYGRRRKERLQELFHARKMRAEAAAAEAARTGAANARVGAAAAAGNRRAAKPSGKPQPNK